MVAEFLVDDDYKIWLINVESIRIRDLKTND